MYNFMTDMCSCSSFQQTENLLAFYNMLSFSKVATPQAWWRSYAYVDLALYTGMGG